MSGRRCSMCGAAAAVERHHPTGALRPPGPNGRRRYLDPTVVDDLCLRCHAAEHATWEAMGLARRCGRYTIFESVELRLRRLAAHLGLVAAASFDHPLYAGLSAAIERWADLLAAAIAGLDDYAPGWRRCPAVYDDRGAR